MDMALGRLVKTGDNSVIVIKLDDVDGKKLPKALKERSYIDYYKSNDNETWEKQLIHCLKVSVQHRLITQNSFVYSEIGEVCVWQEDLSHSLFIQSIEKFPSSLP